jgi:hypothetical protein
LAVPEAYSKPVSFGTEMVIFSQEQLIFIIVRNRDEAFGD